MARGLRRATESASRYADRAVRILVVIRCVPYDDAYITSLTTGASLDRYVLLEGDLLIGYQNEDGQVMVLPRR
jgi:hypothetical protein